MSINAQCAAVCGTAVWGAEGVGGQDGPESQAMYFSILYNYFTWNQKQEAMLW